MNADSFTTEEYDVECSSINGSIDKKMTVRIDS